MTCLEKLFDVDLDAEEDRNNVIKAKYRKRAPSHDQDHEQKPSKKQKTEKESFLETLSSEEKAFVAAFTSPYWPHFVSGGIQIQTKNDHVEAPSIEARGEKDAEELGDWKQHTKTIAGASVGSEYKPMLFIF